MLNLPEISSLFASMASALQNLNPTDGNEYPNLALSISNLNRSLNLSETPGVRVLDAALSLMCFTGPQVYDSVIEYSVRTIATVLSSSIGCKLFRINEEEVLRVGGSISSRDCVDLIEACAAILGKLQGHQVELSALLSCALVRVAVLAPRFECASQSTPALDTHFRYGRTSSLARLSCHLPTEFTIKNGEVPLRLLLWYLDPMILKQDVSQILEEVIKRPFLCLSKEFYERIEWRSKIICLVISPSQFIETRALLQNWFLVTGMASVLEFLTQLVSQVLDIISRPMWWGISMEVGSKLPFSHAYFPHEHQLLRILAGPKSLKKFQHLVYKITGSISHSGGHMDCTSKKAATKIKMVDHKSMWALTMNFLDWFFFASVLLFSDKSSVDNSHSEPIYAAAETYSSQDMEMPCSAAARYIAWILNPISEFHQDLLVDYLTRVSGLWTLECFGPSKCNGTTNRKENSRPDLHNKNGITSAELDIGKVWLWIQEFQDTYIRYCKAVIGFSSSSKVQTCKEFSILQNLLFGRIPLGILIGYSNHLTPAGCELFLHYSATGSVPQFAERRRKCEWQEGSVTLTEKYTRREAIAGIRVAFEITDVTESLSHTIETEENGLNLICQVKSKTGNYLVKCIKRLLQLKIDEDESLQMRRDLLAGLIRWRCQGKDVFLINKDLNDLIDALSCTPPSL
ncbi:hypothetical protein Fot_35176 [Forsythia ovata]|uniref:Uncharacterized protein n=1 Tax=Forsythia ovata TaxID=205694 RepID=A0ABD1SLV4_9LAMI